LREAEDDDEAEEEEEEEEEAFRDFIFNKSGARLHKRLASSVEVH
jgi:hypothetical protein